MLSEIEEEIRDWLYRAKLDEDSADKLLSGDHPIVETALFHCQQLSEKVLKAYLTYRGTQFWRTHDLVALVGLCESLDPSFSGLIPNASDLSQYAVRFRYPTDEPVPSIADAWLRLEWAREIKAFVLSRLPADVL